MNEFQNNKNDIIEEIQPQGAPVKHWRTVQLSINGLVQKVRYNESTITGLFRPFLQRLTTLQQQKGRRILVFLAAPPAVGKSTLALFLEKLSRGTTGLTPIQAIGLDGFHYHNDYLQSHSIQKNGQSIPLYQIKGAPETFDVIHFLDKISHITNEDIRWPVYDRMRHDVVEDVQRIHRPIILLEGNWLLLRHPDWQRARSYADYTLFLSAHPNDLKTRLINRKMQGGLSYEAAAAFYQKSDSENVMRVLQQSVPADETWIMGHDGDYHTEADIQRRKNVSIMDDSDFPLATILRGLTETPTGEEHPPTWQEGYVEGLTAARMAILRQLYLTGSLSSKELCEKFQLKPEELKEIVKPAEPKK